MNRVRRSGSCRQREVGKSSTRKGTIPFLHMSLSETSAPGRPNGSLVRSVTLPEGLDRQLPRPSVSVPQCLSALKRGTTKLSTIRRFIYLLSHRQPAASNLQGSSLAPLNSVLARCKEVLFSQENLPSAPKSDVIVLHTLCLPGFPSA